MTNEKMENKGRAVRNEVSVVEALLADVDANSDRAEVKANLEFLAKRLLKLAGEL